MNPKLANKWTLESKMLYTFLGFFGLLITLAIASTLYIQRYKETARWVEHTHEVIAEIGKSTTLFNLIASSQRGYLLTNQYTFLTQRDQAVTDLNQELKLITRLTADNPAQQLRLQKLKELFDRRVDFHNRMVILLQTAGFQKLQQTLRQDAIFHIQAEQFRSIFADMVKEEQRLLNIRNGIEQQHADNLFKIFVMLFIAILIALPIIFWRIRHDLMLRRQSAIEQKRLTDILDASPDLIATANLQGEYSYLNKGGRNLLGIGQEEDISTQPISRMRPSWATDLIQNEAIPSALNMGLWAGETAFINRAGIEIPVSQVVIVHRNDDGSASHLSTVARDIRDFKKIEHDLTDAALYDKTHSDILQLFNANYDRAQILSGMLDLLAQNHAFPVSAVYSYDEWSGIYRLESTHAAPPHLQNEFKLGEGVMGEAAREHRTVVLSDFSGMPFVSIETGLLSLQPVAIMICPVTYQEKRLAILVLAAIKAVDERDQAFIERLSAQLGVALHNIQQYGDLKLLAEQLGQRSAEISQKNEQLQEVSRVKSEFLATMSHELRTPLNAIIGFSEIMRDGLVGTLTEQQKEYVGDIFESGQHLLSLINDVLDLSKIEAGRMVLEAEMTNIPMLLQNSLSIIKEKAAANQIQLDVDVEDVVGDAWLDARKVKQIVYNLLSNAVKFTPEGGKITLRANIVGRESVEKQAESIATAHSSLVSEGEQFLQISVTDTGIGIAAEDLACLFQPFVQVESTLSRRFEGTGLGLSMVRKLAELHGGAVAVNSIPNQGSTFTVWLHYQPEPLEVVELAKSVAIQHPILLTQSPHVLVVEDDAIAADLIRLQLEADGCSVSRAATAEIALAMLAQGNPPDLITLDIMLPGMDGWEFLTQLKANDKLAQIPVVIISMVADSNKGLSLGAAKVLHKPVSSQDLLAALFALGFVKPEASGQGTKVLVVDDDPKAVEIVSSFLEHAGYSSLRAYGALEAIELAKKQQPDLIILDLMMPEMNGFEVVEALKLSKRTAQIPIIVMTAKLISPQERQVLNGHVLAVMEKSEFNHGNFISEVHRAFAKASKALEAST